MMTDMERSIWITSDTSTNTVKKDTYDKLVSKKGFTLYSNDECNISLLLPADWSAPEGYEKNGYMCEAFSPNDDMWIGYYAGDTEEYYPTMDEYREYVREYYESALEAEGIADDVESSEEMIRINGQDFVKWTIVAKEEREGFDGAKALVTYGRYADGKAFELVFECYAAESMDAFQKMTSAMAESIRFTTDKRINQSLFMPTTLLQELLK